MKPGYRILTAFTISFIISLTIYLVNVYVLAYDPGAAAIDREVIIISLVIFMDVFLGFVCYWLIRNLFSKRWSVLGQSTTRSRNFRIPIDKIHHAKLRAEEREQLHSQLLRENPINQTSIYSQNSSLFAEIIFSKNENNRTLIFFCHGFNDSSEKIRYKTYALAELGYTVLVWDARGMGKSSKAGSKADFFSRNLDTAAIIDFFINNPYYEDYEYVIVGESMGGVSAAYTLKLFPNKIDKCILISTPSIFNETFPRNPYPFSKKWIQRLNYRVRGINPYPEEELNRQISPYFLFEKMKQDLSKNDWKNYTNSKILLIHSITDGLIEVDKCEQNAKILNLSGQNVILFETGNHNQIKNELGIISAIHNFLIKQ